MRPPSTAGGGRRSKNGGILKSSGNIGDQRGDALGINDHGGSDRSRRLIGQLRQMLLEKLSVLFLDPLILTASPVTRRSIWNRSRTKLVSSQRRSGNLTPTLFDRPEIKSLLTCVATEARVMALIAVALDRFPQVMQRV